MSKYEDTKNGISLYRIPRLNLRRDSIFYECIVSTFFLFFLIT